MATLAEQRLQELYGPDRNVRFQNVKNVLTRSHVLQDGEYNFTSRKLNKDVWRTTHSTDFSGVILDPNSQNGTSNQLVNHFHMGNQSGRSLDKDIFRRSTTMSDFLSKPTKKPPTHTMSRVINWPDMAPRLMKDRRVGPSEYTSTFITNLKKRGGPHYPKVDTSKMQLPLDPTKFWKQRSTNFSLGSDSEGLISEQQRAYGTGTVAFRQDQSERTAASDANKTMQEQDKVSHVFRGGDYNDIAGSFLTTCNDDYGPRTVSPGEAALHKAQKNDDEEDIEEERINLLQKYARENTVPVVFSDAEDGRNYQTNAHFHFGHDPESGQSIYAKDFALSAMANRMPPFVKAPPSAGKLLQNDPNQSSFGMTSSSVDFQNHKYEPYRNSDGKTALEQNLDRKATNNVVFSFDLGRNTSDRQKSLNHTDYIGPPSGFKTMSLAPRHVVMVDYLQTDDALPYPAPRKETSEAAHNFTGMFSAGNSASSRRVSGKKQARARLNDGRSTHFVVGYTPFDFKSETTMKFRGEKKNDIGVNPAGKTEKQPPCPMFHLSHSANTLDLRAADPYITNTRESLPARLSYSAPQAERSNTTSIMKKDYGPLGSRDLTEAQLKVVDKYNKVTQKEISHSHLFHTDTSGRNNFVSTAMDDFIMPESMTGQKFLSAR